MLGSKSATLMIWAQFELGFVCLLDYNVAIVPQEREVTANIYFKNIFFVVEKSFYLWMGFLKYFQEEALIVGTGNYCLTFAALRKHAHAIYSDFSGQ